MYKRQTREFILGHIAMFTLGGYSIEQLVNVHKGSSYISIELIDSEQFKASDYFDVLKNKWSLKNFKLALIKAKSILQPELKLILVDEKYNPGIQEFYHQGGLKEYLVANLNDSEYCPKSTYSNSINSENYNMEWSIAWLNETNDPFQESYVN